jgi:hypothetical protein
MAAAAISSIYYAIKSFSLITKGPGKDDNCTQTFISSCTYTGHKTWEISPDYLICYIRQYSCFRALKFGINLMTRIGVREKKIGVDD